MNITTYQSFLDKDTNHNILVKDKCIPYHDELHFNSPDLIAKIMREVFQLDQLAEEEVYMISLNTKGFPLGFFLISHGTVNASLIGAREIFIKALLSGASSIVLVHNHPSQSPVPSKEDKNVTTRILEAGKLIGIPLIDHLIITKTNYFSLVSDCVSPPHTTLL